MFIPQIISKYSLMKNHFFFSYVGNKRDEVETIYDTIKGKLSRITTIVEPFCGSSAFSFYLSTLYPGRFQFILNDNDQYLIELYQVAKSPQKFNKLVKRLDLLLKNINKAKYDKLKKSGSFEGFIIMNYIYKINRGLFPSTGKIKTIENFMNAPIINFLRTENVILSHGDGIDCYKKYKDASSNLIFLDPPYLITNNTFYTNPELNIYEYLTKNNIVKEKAFIVLVLELSWIIQLLFKNNIKRTYAKKYQTSKNDTVHAIISN